MSKYLGGDSDVVTGVIFGSNEDVRQIFENESLNIGAVPNPFMAWLIMGGIKTLHVRMSVHYKAKYLENHERIESVL